MESLRWILIFAGVAILVLLYFSGRPKRLEERGPSAEDDFTPGGRRVSRAEQQKDIDPLLGDAPGPDEFSTFDDVDPDDFIRPAAKTAYDENKTDYAFDEPEQRPAAKNSSGGITTLAQKIEAFSERLSPKRRQRVEASEPVQLHDEEVAEDAAYANKIVTLHIVAPPNALISGEQLFDLFQERNYHYGDMSIFHSMHNDKTVFSIAKMVEPGYFDINNIESFETPGITLILQLPGPVPADVAFEVLVSEAYEMGNALGATVLDERRSTLTKQTVQHMLEGIYEYMHREKYFGSVAS